MKHYVMKVLNLLRVNFSSSMSMLEFLEMLLVKNVPFIGFISALVQTIYCDMYLYVL